MREILDPDAAVTEGARLLRGLLLRRTGGAIGLALGVSARAVRRWALEDRAPSPDARAVLETKLQIPAESWAQPAAIAPKRSAVARTG